ncbi:MAG: acetyltransferase [Bacillales bacterium]|jgi:sugar O-acyltransferase (sialic acid O-acetyltransferase NeuD family)|nr:acetyltransferase [Bacillales bacterium]
MNKNVIIIGAGGHGKVIADIIRKSGDQVLGFLDDANNLKEVCGLPVLGKVSDYEPYCDSAQFILAIGNNHVRKEVSENMTVNWYTAIHPSAILANDCKIGEGTVVMANSVVNSDTKIGKHCIINTGAIIEHDNRIDNYVHVSPNGTLCGTVSVGELTHIGASATVKNNIQIIGNCVIGIGAVVVKSINEPGTYIGVPATKLANNKGSF